jgi:hypothetical protein
VSSEFRILCLSHDPAIPIDHDWHRFDEANAAACDPASHELVAPHKNCDLLTGRWSGALVEVCCPAAGEWAHGRHTAPQWIATDWLRLLHKAIELNEPDMHDAVMPLVRTGCWSAQRLRRLRREFGYE